MPSPSSSANAASRPPGERLKRIVTTLQFAWFVGHALTLIGTLLFALSFITFSTNVFAYRMTFLGALISYGVIIYRAVGMPTLSTAYVQRLVRDENAQYLLLALYWFFSRPVEVTLLPFAIFSTFNAIGYIRSMLIPTVFPFASGQTCWQSKAQQFLKAWSDKNYDPAMRLVARIEVILITGRLVLGVLKLRIVPLFLFAQFLRFRYYLPSRYTRDAFRDVRVQLDRLLLPPTADPRIPPMVFKAYEAVKSLIIKYGEAVVERPPAAAHAHQQ